MSIFDRKGCTLKVVCPFKYNDTYLKVHPNGAAVYSDNKKFEFLLPWIVLSHDLLPPLPLFWALEEKGVKTIGLHRTSLWLHEETIEWLAETNEAFPPELRDSIMPRVRKRLPKSQAKPPGKTQASPAPKTVRWEKRPTVETDSQPAQDPDTHEAQPAQSTTTDLNDSERLYLHIQASSYAAMCNASNPAGRPPIDQQSKAPDAETGNDKHDQASTVPPPDVTMHSKQVTTDSADTTAPATEPNATDRPEKKIEAQTLADIRPATPPAPTAPDPQEVTPETGELSSVKPSDASDQATQGTTANLHPPASPFQIPMELSPTESPDASVATAVIESSPEQEEGDDITQLDMSELTARHFAALAEVQQKSQELFEAQNRAWRLTKRMRTMQTAQASLVPPAVARPDIPIMERCD